MGRVRFLPIVGTLDPEASLIISVSALGEICGFSLVEAILDRIVAPVENISVNTAVDE